MMRRFRGKAALQLRRSRRNDVTGVIAQDCRRCNGCGMVLSGLEGLEGLGGGLVLPLKAAGAEKLVLRAGAVCWC